MKTKLLSLVVILLTSCSVASTGSYEDAVVKWKSYKDVANWLNSHFSFEKSRQRQILSRLKKQGPSGLLIRNPATLYENNHRGYCADSANFAIKSLNKIDPSYNARWVFIWNERGRPNH